jgi:hypothetical protein
LQLFGVDVAWLTQKGGKELVYNEFGCGGGASVSGDAPARTVEDAQSYPFFGVYGPYTRKLDPWRNYLPAGVLSGTRQYQQRWYAAACLWLLRKGGPTWRVDHVFLWNLNSWDVQVGVCAAFFWVVVVVVVLLCSLSLSLSCCVLLVLLCVVGVVGGGEVCGLPDQNKSTHNCSN